MMPDYTIRLTEEQKQEYYRNIVAFWESVNLHGSEYWSRHARRTLGRIAYLRKRFKGRGT